MSDALATLPWVEQGSIKADRASRSVRFGINDKKLFSLEEIRTTLAAKYQGGLAVASGPEDEKISTKDKAAMQNPD